MMNWRDRPWVDCDISLVCESLCLVIENNLELLDQAHFEGDADEIEMRQFIVDRCHNMRQSLEGGNITLTRKETQ